MQEWNEVKAINEGVEALLATVEIPEIRGGVSHSLKTSGKRLRPLTLLLINELNHGNPDVALDAAIAMECIHTASLIQDDILDEGLKRRGESTSHEKFGIFLAMVSADYLISKAVMQVSRYDPGTVSAFGRSGLLAAEGELLDVMSRRIKPTADDYIVCVHKKTAALFESSFEMGARIAGANEEKTEICREMGLEFGIAYQIVDDLIEYTQIDDETKKSALQSFILPLVYAESMSQAEAVDACMRQVEARIGRIDALMEKFEDCEAKRKLQDVIGLLRNYNGVKIK